MRKAFVRSLCEAADADPRILLLTGDLGYMALEPFRDRFPGRFINAGVAEQNMVGVATGLAEAGYIPYCYSIATFLSMRALEFIRNGPVLHRLPVRLVGMGMGFEYGHGGFSHHAVEDIAMLRTLPGLTVVVPADSRQAETAVRATRGAPGPVYYTLGKDDSSAVPGLNGAFDLTRVQVIGDHRDLVIVSMGSVSIEAAAAAAQLESRGVSCALAIVSSFNPDPVDHLAELLAPAHHVISVEAQVLSGGLGSFVSSVVTERGLRCRVTSLGVRTSPDGTSGSQADRWRAHGVDRASIVRAALAAAEPGTPFVSAELASIVLPVYNQAAHIGPVLEEYAESLARLPFPFELIAVVNGRQRDQSLEICQEISRKHPVVRTLRIEAGGWGLAVRHGLTHARGDLLCFTNSSRTSAQDLLMFILFGSVHPDCVIKANRKIRESTRRRLGSLLYNLECRALFDLPYWDINGTPKVFSRQQPRLLELTRNDDLIDLEFNVVCRRSEYRVVEVPIVSVSRHSKGSTTGYGTALRLYRGAWEMKKALG